MKSVNLEQISIDELWKLHFEIGEALAAKLSAEKEVLEGRLKQLSARPEFERRRGPSERRHYPPVFPKFRNPVDASETWSGRGKQPRWLMKQLESGRRIDDFRILQAAQ